MHSICKLLHIEFPLIQAGMVWVSGGRLAAASANAGILGVIGAGSMNPEVLKSQILKAKALTNYPKRLAVNVPLLYDKTQTQFEIALELGINIFITSAGSPKAYTSWLKSQGATVIHVVSTPDFAKKSQDAGCDAVIAEGFEAGGHNGRDEITTMVLIPQVVSSVSIPVIAAGGIADGGAMLAAFCLGAQGVQMGTRFVATVESSAHENFKQAILKSHPDSTMLAMKKYIPVRLLKNKFYEEVKLLEEKSASKEELIQLLGKGRAKKGMLEGDLESGELEIGQVCSMIKSVDTVENVVLKIKEEFNQKKYELHSLK